MTARLSGDPAMEHAMLIILCLYILALSAIFSKFKLARLPADKKTGLPQ
jgi:hypothetical protein